MIRPPRQGFESRQDGSAQREPVEEWIGCWAPQADLICSHPNPRLAVRHVIMIILMEQHGLYDQLDLYDLIAPKDFTLERFYVETARERGGRVLDLACGSGRLTIPLASAGFEVTGGDLSAKMLEHAQRAAEAQGVEVDLVQLDMRHFDLGRTFDTIIVAMNPVLHLHSLDDFRDFFDPQPDIYQGTAGSYSMPSCQI